MTIRAPLAITNFANFSPINFSPNFGPVLARKPSPRGHAQKPTSQYRRPHGHTTVNEQSRRFVPCCCFGFLAGVALRRSAAAVTPVPQRPCRRASPTPAPRRRRRIPLVPPPSSSGVRPSVPPPASPRSQQLTPLRLVELCG